MKLYKITDENNQTINNGRKMSDRDRDYYTDLRRRREKDWEITLVALFFLVIGLITGAGIANWLNN